MRNPIVRKHSVRPQGGPRAEGSRHELDTIVHDVLSRGGGRATVASRVVLRYGEVVVVLLVIDVIDGNLCSGSETRGIDHNRA